MNILSFIFCTLGVIFLILGLLVRAKIKLKLNTSIKSTGKIISLREEVTEQGYYDEEEGHNHNTRMITYYPTVEYYYNNNKYSTELKIGKTSYKEGEELEIYINKNNPSEAMHIGMKKLPIIFIGIGTLLLALGILFIILAITI